MDDVEEVRLVVAIACEPSVGGVLGAGLTPWWAPWWHFSGAFHPAVSHFPIALLCVAALVESWSVLRRHGRPMQTTLVCLYLGTAAAVVATVLGLGNAAASGDKGTTLDLHKWLGIGVAVLAIISVVLSLLVLRRRDAVGRRTIWAYRGGLFAAAGLVGLVGSFGGKLVHGETYYADAYAALQRDLAEPTEAPKTHVTTELASAPKIETPAVQVTTATQAAPAPAPAPEPEPVPALAVAILPAAPTPMPAPSAVAPDLGGGQIDYARDIEPIFLAHCTRCHNDTKKKGGYRLDSREHVFAAGQSGKVAVLPGKSDESLLIKMVEGKGEFADSIMPPKGEPLTFQQIALIRRWIDEGAQSSAP